eukprot:TRINITY_DN5812_c0_g1_i1.p1 TRINITY_DN5812_c0_g1~~TRINITY_DN5812_c0_g1_i1.p1  ORF type:complete len:132 (-),score=45.67 TRINITY_DN5812_c0_g1_i1:153-509(-)
MSEQQQLIALQTKLTQSSRALSQSLSLTQANRQEQAKGRITISELKALPPTTNAYRSSGRMFIKENLPELVTTIEGQLVKVDEMIIKLEDQSKYLKQQVKSAEGNMNEVIAQMRSKGV